MNYAIVIGIDYYKKKPLEAAVSDAKSFASFLISKQLVSANSRTISKINGLIDDGAVSGVDNLKLILSNENNATDQKVIDKAIQEIINDANNHSSENNRLYFYFAGHGIGVTYDKTALCLSEWPEWFNDCISSSEYKSWLINCGVFNEILIFLDCCREYDQMIDTKVPNLTYNYSLGNIDHKILICNATKFGKLSYEINEIGTNKKRGAFTSFLIQSLSGDAVDNQNVITSYSLKNHINRNFEAFASQHGKNQVGDAFTQGTDGDNIEICKVVSKNLDCNCEITFVRNANVSLIDKDLKLVRSGDVNVGDKWFVNLEVGFSILVDNEKNEKKLIENYSKKTVTYVEF